MLPQQNYNPDLDTFKNELESKSVIMLLKGPCALFGCAVVCIWLCCPTFCRSTLKPNSFGLSVTSQWALPPSLFFSGGVTEATAGATTTGRGRGRQPMGRLWPKGALQPQPGSHGAGSPAGTGGASEAARTPDQRDGTREREAAAGGDAWHGKGSVSSDWRVSAHWDRECSVRQKYPLLFVTECF